VASHSTAYSVNTRPTFKNPGGIIMDVANTSSGGVTTSQPDLSSTSGPSGVQGGGNTSAPQTPVVTSTPNDWTSSLNEQQKLYVGQKGFKDQASVLDSYQNLEKLMGAPKERLLKLPEKADAPEWGEIYDKLGRPKNANEYTFAKPSGKDANPEFTDWAQKQFHALGLTKSQGETLAAKWNEYAVGDQSKAQETQANNLKVEQTALKKEWGAAFEQQMKTCSKAAQTFGLGPDEVSKLESALGYSATLKFLASVGSKLGEDSFVTGDGGGFQGALTPDRAQAEIADLRKDKDFTSRYLNGGFAEKAKMERLMKFAYPDLPQD
jgi:hypothetical protein